MQPCAMGMVGVEVATSSAAARGVQPGDPASVRGDRIRESAKIAAIVGGGTTLGVGAITTAYEVLRGSGPGLGHRLASGFWAGGFAAGIAGAASAMMVAPALAGAIGGTYTSTESTPAAIAGGAATGALTGVVGAAALWKFFPDPLVSTFGSTVRGGLALGLAAGAIGALVASATD